MSGNFFNATNVKGQFMSLNGITGDSNSSLNLAPYSSSPNGCILGKNDTEANQGTGAWQTKLFSSFNSSLTNDGFAIADATGYMTIPPGTYMINCVITGRKDGNSDERYIRLDFRKGTTKLYSVLEQIVDISDSGSTYVNIVMSFIRTLKYGNDYNFLTGSDDDGDCRLWSGGSTPYANYCNFYRIG